MCLYGVVSIANYSNQQIWSARARNVGKIASENILPGHLNRYPSVDLKIHVSNDLEKMSDLCHSCCDVH